MLNEDILKLKNETNWEIDNLVDLIKNIDKEELRIILFSILCSSNKDTELQGDYSSVEGMLAMYSDIKSDYFTLISPIEKKLYIALKSLVFIKGKTICVKSKCNFIFENRRYTADLFVDYMGDKGLIIECDGHFYHRNTPKQVTNDNEKDYAFKINGYDILRFNGTQINKDPLKCAMDIFDFLEHKSEKTQVFWR